MKNFIRRLFNKANLRLSIFGFLVILAFAVLAVKLYILQIINGDYYNQEVSDTTLKSVEVKATRGSIYDRYGRPLAINESSYVVNIDPSVGVDDINSTLSKLITLLEKNGETIDISLPITSTKPRAFMFDGSETQEKRWKTDMNLDENLSADQCYDKLKSDFEIPEDLSEDMAYKILGIRCELYKNRYTKYVPVTIAYDVSEKTTTEIQEQASEYPCAYIDMESTRKYPMGKYLAHIIGYTGKITDTELESNKETYSLDDIIGKDGIEKAFESTLKGTDGSQYIEVDSSGRRISVVEDEGNDPLAGGNVYLTIDAELQKAIYDKLEDELARMQQKRLSGGDYSYQTSEVYKNFIKNNTIWIDDVLNAKEETVQYKLKEYIISSNSNASEDTELARETLLKGYENNEVSESSLLIALYEQGQISDDSTINSLKNGEISSTTALLRLLSSKNITPQMTGLDPCTGSVVVTDVHTGSVLAAVSYPSYDNNELVNTFNNEYYYHLQNDPTTPMLNRPFTEPRAPGSTFKMITAIAGLQEGVISPYTTIADKGTFTDAGLPYARCWIDEGKGSHGTVDVSKALEVSCNYFFYTVSFNLGNGTNSAIDILNRYMEKFGLNSPTGVEIYELYNSMKDYPSFISSPAYKDYIVQTRDPDASDSDKKWTAGDTIRTAIGQSYNNYTSATLAKYIATLANGGTRYTMHLMDKLSDSSGNITDEYTPVVEDTIEIDDDNLQAVYKGMLGVTQGSSGTLREVFRDFKVDVAAKSGTAQESSKRSEHTIFVAFAPYDNPQIAISVLIPYGNDKSAPAANVAKTAISTYLQLDAKPENKFYNTLLR